MSDNVITVESLGKRYLLSHQQAPQYTALRDVVSEHARKLARGVAQRGTVSSPRREEFWALQDISFQIQQGDRLGIIGRNGAGKSTLLKILSKITPPTLGRVRLRGRVASLLEVGTGFHPELTGRENVFLNGAILGMTRSEIRRKFDEIVAFAEIERFLDTPVKRYSSGMYVRLAFAVAAHLEPEILLVDEVLAVGDAEFQKRCLGKMDEVATEEGRTIVFVSHNMGAIKRLCPQTIYLRQGRLERFAKTEQVISEYISQGLANRGQVIWEETDPSAGDTHARVHGLTMRGQEGEASSDFDFLDPITVEIDYQVLTAAQVRLIISIHNDAGVHVFITNDAEAAAYPITKQPGHYLATCTIPGHLLNDAQYFVTLYVDIPNFKMIVKQEGVLSFRVHATSGIAARRDNVYGIVCPEIQWHNQILGA